ncbi:uncharacterized protein LOC116267098 isoform X1 [Nymphaea colorata]|nr:uncharacterized protein LOC116267098 isoform X1 [Nymphaea colorata]XP_031504525.1 uncharacterized protein LOC116267098 isoform X1 [Nymphaea colorata]XP_031504526.1 uncharacterized protein LOC116267098 isoform X1 [Nymphaea colorata]
MPLFKRKPFPLAEVPPDLKPHELVFQVRFTMEIFRDYKEYLRRINLYRQRFWTCKVTGKTNLTYEEALVSEHRATEKAQQFPKELIVPVLQMIQFSTMRLKDLIYTVSTRVLEHFLEGEEVYYRKEDSVVPCKILKVFEKTKDGGDMSYEVGWLDKHKKVTDTSTENADKLVRKKLPFSRQMLKTFIRESTMQSSPWVVHETLAQKYGLPTEMPDELRDKINAQKRKCNKIADGRKRSLMENGNINRKKRSKTGNEHADVLGEAQKETYAGKPTAQNTNIGRKKRIKADKEYTEVSGTAQREPISEKMKIDSVNGETKLQLEVVKYPIDDLLVQPCPGDPEFKDRPAPSTDFAVSMNCVGNLLMVWDFCSSFSRMLRLWPFSLEDFENAVAHKGSNVNLIIEAHAAILRLLLKDEGDYYNATRGKRRKPQITFMNWTEYLCDFLEMEDVPELSGHISTIKRGHYGLLDTHAKLDIFQVLVSYALTTDLVREQLEEYIEQRQILSATNREAAVEEARKRRKQQQVLKEAASDAKGRTKGEGLDNDVEGNVGGSEIGTQAEDVSSKRKLTSNGHRVLPNGVAKHTSRRNEMKQTMDGKVNAVKQKKSTEINGGSEEKQLIKKGLEEKKQRLENFEKEIEKHFIRTNPLGKDRNYSRYWFFRREGRVFVENSDFERWGYYSTKEEIDQLIRSLNPKGERERALQRQLQKHYGRICVALQKRSKEIAQRFILEGELRRSARVKSQPKESLGPAYLKYVNKWKES